MTAWGVSFLAEQSGAAPGWGTQQWILLVDGGSIWYPSPPHAERRPLTSPSCDLERMPLICIPQQQLTDPLSSLPHRQMEEVLSLNEDYIFLRKVQKCQTEEGQKSTLLDCGKVLKGFQDLQCKVDCCWVDTTPAEGGGRLLGTHKPSPKAFLKSWGYRTSALFYTFFYMIILHY